MRLTEEQSEELRALTVSVLLALRREYLGTPGVNVLKHWDQISDRMRAAARTCATPAEWTTRVQRDLRVPSLSLSSSHSCSALVSAVAGWGCAREWLDLVEREHGYLIARTRLDAEQRKDARQAAQAKRDAQHESEEQSIRDMEAADAEKAGAAKEQA